ncbi:MAG: FumA C-terminus/TtdB family hydratase beta subunit [Candidatus Thermoplasmatota archaeon]
MKVFETPLDHEKIKKLRVGDTFYITGTIFTARDAAHEKLLEIDDEDVPFDPSKYAMFHCGPAIHKEEGEWKVVSAGPTTSIRMDIFEDDFIERFGTKVIIGKGGMGERTLKALEKHGGVYCQYTGGAGALMANAIKEVEDVYFLEELGIPEAFWMFRVEEAGPFLVTMDSAGNSIHDDVAEEVSKNLEKVKSQL